MNCTITPIRLNLLRDFVVAGGHASVKENHLVTIDGIGLGEASGSVYYGSSPEEIRKDLETLVVDMHECDPNRVPRYLAERALDFSPPALCAISTAWHDWQAKALGMPLFAQLTLPPPQPLPTSVTVSVGDAEALRERLAAGYRHIKIKMDDDIETNREVLAFIAKSTVAIFRIDANGSWSPETAEMVIKSIPSDKIELIEQPFAADNVSAWERFHSQCAAPLIMDESISFPADVKRASGYVDGINVKIQKSGTLENAVAIIKEARAHGLKVMIGCMIESSVGIAAAYHLSGLADFIDLDGRLLVADDSFSGLTYADGTIVLEGAYGHGVSAR